MSDELSIPKPTYRIPRRGHGMDPGTRKLALIAGGLGASLLAVVGAWSMIGRHSGAVPVVQADERPIRVKPENPGGMQVAGANNDILSGGSDTSGGKLAPPAETPAPQALRAPPAALPPAAKIESAAPLVQVAPKPAAPVARAIAAADKPAAPVARSVVTADKPAAARPAPTGKSTLVQLAAVSSEDAARNEWRRLGKRMPDILGHHEPAVSKIEREGRTYWRLRTGGFADVAQATQFCEKVRAKGSSCSVADF